MRSFAAVFLAVLIFNASVPAKFDTGRELAARYISERNYAEAVKELASLREADSGKFHLNNYDYLLARIAEKEGDTALAMENYHGVLLRNSVLSEYALWHLSRIAADSGNRFLERIYLTELLVLYPDSLPAAASENKLARSWSESGDHARAIAVLENLSIKASQKNSDKAVSEMLRRENTALLAESYLHTGDREKARELYTKLIEETADAAMPDDVALAGVRGLDLIDGGSDNFQKKAPKITDSEHKKRAGIYQFNRDFHNARLHYTAIINEHPHSTAAAESVFQIGRGYVQTGNFSEAINWFERLIEQFPGSDLVGESLLNAGSAYSRVWKYREAVVRYQRYIDRFPEGEKLDRAYLNIIDIYRDQGTTTDALKQISATAEKFRGKTAEAQALFAGARIYLSFEDWSAALDSLNKLNSLAELGGSKVPGGTDKAEIAFMRGYALEMQRRFAEAIDVYLSIPDGRNEFYGGLATVRLRLLRANADAQPAISTHLLTITKDFEDKTPETRRAALQSAVRLTNEGEAKQNLLEKLRKTYAEIPAYSKLPDLSAAEVPPRKVIDSPIRSASSNRHSAIADEFIFLGLADEAAPELAAANKLKGGNAAVTLAVIYARGDRAYKIISLAEPQWNKLPADYQIELIPDDAAKALYPVPFTDELLRTAERFDVEPHFLLALMRQESRFRPDVKSNAAARGLMQFISTTSHRIAGSLRLDDFRQNDLYDPNVAILFGGKYVADLFKLFPNQPEAVAASYNGGEDNMKRWLERSRANLPGRYVPEIAYSQSKDYVRKVMTSYRVYKLLYDEKLSPAADLKRSE